MEVKLDRAIELFQREEWEEALQLLQQLERETSPDLLYRIEILFYAGLSWYNTNAFDNAIESLETAIAISRQIEDVFYLVLCLYHCANIQYQNENKTVAFELQHECYQISLQKARSAENDTEKQDLIEQKRSAALQLGRWYYELGQDYDKPAQFYLAAAVDSLTTSELLFVSQGRGVTETKAKANPEDGVSLEKSLESIQSIQDVLHMVQQNSSLLHLKLYFPMEYRAMIESPFVETPDRNIVSWLQALAVAIVAHPRIHFLTLNNFPRLVSEVFTLKSNLERLKITALSSEEDEHSTANVWISHLVATKMSKFCEVTLELKLIPQNLHTLDPLFNTIRTLVLSHCALTCQAAPWVDEQLALGHLLLDNAFLDGEYEKWALAQLPLIPDLVAICVSYVEH